MRKTVMIFGASSFVGSNLIEMLSDDFRVIGTYHKTPVEFPGVTCLSCDVLKKDYVSKLVSRFKPDFTIYAAGLTSLKECKLKPKFADALNTAGAVNVCLATERIGAKFVLLSTAFVLGGEDQLYREGDLPMPGTAYGHSFSASEFYVQRSCLNYLILRCSYLYGRSYNALKPNIFETYQAAFLKHQTIAADDSVYTGFLDVEILAKVLKVALKANVTNRLFQLSSSDFMTRFGFAQEMARIFKKDANIIQRTTIPFPIEERAQRKSGNFFFKMDNLNLEGFLGTKMPGISDSLNLTSKRLSEIN